jgi:hypothetical protein
MPRPKTARPNGRRSTDLSECSSQHGSRSLGAYPRKSIIQLTAPPCIGMSDYFNGGGGQRCDRPRQLLQ